MAERVGLALPQSSAAQPLSQAIPEGEFESTLRLYAMRTLKMLYYHTHNSKRSDPGFPDSAILHPDGGTLFLWELKRDGKEPGPAQVRWLRALANVTAVDARVVRPSDWQSIPTWLTTPNRKENL
jgi:hypothetical protein